MIKIISFIGLLISYGIVMYLLVHPNIDFVIFLYISIIFCISLFSILIYELKFKKPNEEPFKKREFLLISLLSVYQPLYFYAHNLVEIDFKSGVLICSIVYLQFILIFYLINIFFKDKNKSLFIGIILSFAVINLYKNVIIVYIIAGLLLYLISIVSLTKIKKPIIVFTTILLLLTGFEFGYNSYKIIKSNTTEVSEDNSNILPYLGKETRNRNIYVILLDAYSGTNILEQKFGFDNSDFINELKKEGFYVFDKMYSNYDTTYASIPTILNLDYFENTNFNTTSSAIENALLYKIAKLKGYKTFFIYNYIFHFKSSKYLDSIINSINKSLYNFSLYNICIFFSDSIYKDIVCSKEIITLLAKEKSDILLNISGKNFVFMHMLMPHPPYLFDENGNPSEYSYDPENGYLPYLKYTNKWTLDKIKKIKEEEKDNLPVIIVTGDHGMRDDYILESQFSTFTAYYNPEQEYSHVKNSQTLVNFFINFANYEFNTTFPPKKNNISCIRIYCGGNFLNNDLNDLEIKKALNYRLDLTDKFIK